MDHPLAVNVDQPPSNTSQLGDCVIVNQVVVVMHQIENSQALADLHLGVPSQTH